MADLRTWLCKDHQNKTDWECAGPSGKNINVVFSGHAVIDKALDAARMKSKGVECLPKSKKYCDKMADFMVSTTHEAKSREEAENMMIAPGAKDEANCGKCFAPTPKAVDVPQPFSKQAGLYEGVPFLAHVVGECKDEPNLKQIFSKHSKNTILITEYVERCHGFDGFFTKDNVAALTEAAGQDEQFKHGQVFD